MKKPRLSLLAFVGLMFLGLFGPMAVAQFQSGQKTLTGFPTVGLIPIDNGSSIFTVLPQAAGTVTLTEATPVTVTNANVTTGSIIVFTLKTVGGTVGAYPVIDTITPGTGFTVKGSASDTSIYSFVILG